MRRVRSQQRMIVKIVIAKRVTTKRVTEKRDKRKMKVEWAAGTLIVTFDENDNTSLIYGVEMADPVCVKLNDLIRRGKIDRTRILYKFLNDVCNSLQSFAPV